MPAPKRRQDNRDETSHCHRISHYVCRALLSGRSREDKFSIVSILLHNMTMIMTIVILAIFGIKRLEPCKR